MPVTERIYGVTSDGSTVKEFCFTNRHGYEARVLDYGCTLTHLLVPTGRGPVDVVLGYDSLSDYERGSMFHGALLGRYANRIKDSRFTLYGQEYHLPPNDLADHLHGTFSRTVFTGDIRGDAVVCFHTVSPAGEDGFPGALELNITYTLTAADAFIMDFWAVTDAPTYVNLSNHTYWNLAGAGNGTVLGHDLTLGASSFLGQDRDGCLTSSILPVANTPLDFRSGAVIGRGAPFTSSHLKRSGGYDHCFLLEDGATFAARASCPETGLVLELSTTQRALQVDTGNRLDRDGVPGKGGVPYPAHGGFALMTQRYPVLPAHPFFPSTLLLPGEIYHEVAAYHVFTER